MDIKEFKNYITEVKIDLSEYFDGSEEYIAIREPTTREFQKLYQGTESAGDEVFLGNFLEILPDLIVEHSFTANSQPAKPAAVADMLCKKMPIVMKVVEEFQKTIPLAPTNPKDSEDSQK